MAMHYLQPEDAGNPHRLPNIETFQAAYGTCRGCDVMKVEIAAPERGMQIDLHGQGMPA